MPEEPYKYRNPDGSLRLDEALGERYVKHYTGILSSSNKEFQAMQLAMSVQASPVDDPSPAYSWREPRRGMMTDDGWWLSAEGGGARTASSCTDLAVVPEVCWDVCGYYRRLGLHWRATRKDILRAQLRLDPGRDHDEISYAVSQLMDPVIRRAYDRVPLGGVFMGDRGIRQMIERAAALAAARHNAEAWAADPEGYAELATDQGAVLKGWGFDKNGVSDAEARDRLSGGAFRRGDSSDELGSSLSGWLGQWGWYRLSDPHDEDPWEDVADKVVAVILERWQAMVARAIAAFGERAEFAVGIWPGHGVKVWRDSNDSCIIFLVGRAVPTQQMARDAAFGFLARRYSRDNNRDNNRDHQGRLRMPILDEGDETAKLIDDALKKNRPGFYRVPDFGLKSGQEAVLRFATEKNKILTLEVHRFIPTKDKPEECKWEKWPKQMWAGCLRGKWFRLRDAANNLTDDFEPGYGKCHIHDQYAGVAGKYKKDMSQPDTMTFGVAVEQVPVTSDGKPDSPVIGFTDALVEYKTESGEIMMIPKLLLVTQRWSNFWHPVTAAAILPPKSIRDKFYSISRQDNDYTISSLGAVQDEKPALYEETMKLVGFNLRDYLMERTTLDWYNKFFIEGALPEGGYGGKDDGDSEEESSTEAAPAAAAAGPKLDTAEMEKFRSRMSGRGSK